MNKENCKPIHASIWNPSNSFFKSSANDRAMCTVYYCEKSETCSLLKSGQCVNYAALSKSCPHGYVTQETGYTKRAKNFYSWITKKTEQWKDYKRINGHAVKKIAEVGDWIYLPYNHITMNEQVPFKSHTALLFEGSQFLKKEDFTIENLEKIIKFRPQALFGGEILAYQRKEIPLLLIHLQEVFPKMYAELIQKNPDYVSMYNLETKDYVGREALLKTINACELKIGKHTFNWNGTSLVSKTFDPLWIDIKSVTGKKAIESIDVTIIPDDTASIKITDNSQVSDKTVFVN